MRIRIAAPALVGALALGMVAMPTSAFAATSKPVITRASASDIVLGLSGKFTQVLRISATDKVGIASIKAVPWPDKAAAQGDSISQSMVAGTKPLNVIGHTSTSQTAGLSFTENYNVKSMHLPNQAAGMVFDIAVLVTDKQGHTTFNPKAGTFSFKRADVLSEKTSATKLRKGANLTVKGQLNRADWDAFAWRGYAGRTVALQFRKAGSSHWTTVRVVRSSSTGALSATVRDTRSGSWRFAYAGDPASGAANSATTWVTVK